MIAHPQSPFAGQHYKDPIELIDIYPTINEILKAPYDHNKIYKGMKNILPQGKSLAPIILGREMWEYNFPHKRETVQFRENVLQSNNNTINGNNNKNNNEKVIYNNNNNNNKMPLLAINFAISQVLKCAERSKVENATFFTKKSNIINKSNNIINHHKSIRINPILWKDCDLRKKNHSEDIYLLGYSLRTPEYKYIAYFYLNRTTFNVDLDKLPYQQELYDHKNETLNDFTHRELINLAFRSSYIVIVKQLKAKLINFIKNNIIFATHK